MCWGWGLGIKSFGSDRSERERETPKSFGSDRSERERKTGSKVQYF